MNYQIRRAEIGDLEQIQNLLNKLCEKEFNEFDETINPSYGTTENGKKFTEERIEDPNNSFCMVAVDEGKVIGYFLGGINMVEDYRTVNKIGEGESMFVEEKYRGQGIGTKFLGFFEEWCKEKKLNRIRLVASSRNKKAIDLYEKLGFEGYDLQLEKNI